MHCHSFPLIILLFSFIGAPFVQAYEDFIERVNDALYFQTADGGASVQFGGWLDLEGYYFPHGAPGFILDHSGDSAFFRPRLSLTADAFMGDRIYAFTKFRWDDGFDVNYEKQKARFDELFVRADVLDDLLTVQLGRFATIFGNYAGRHDTWDNPFVTSPLPYDNLTSVLDGGVRPNALSFSALRNVPNNVKTWTPVIWGPAYTQGLALLSRYGKVDLSFSIKNAALSSRPIEWADNDWQHPTYTGRLQYNHSAAWQWGLSGSMGSYLRNQVEEIVLPAGNEFDDYNQYTVGTDFAYSKGKLQVWGEGILSRFEVPFVGDVDIYSYYLEAKYKIARQWFVAGRWGQQFYDSLDTGSGSTKWDNDLFQVDGSIGYRFDRHSQLKLQGSFQHQDASFQNSTYLLALQYTFQL